MASFNHYDPSSTFSTPASTTLFRRLSWEGTIPIEVHVDPKELPAGSDRGLDVYYLQAPRTSYLPLHVPDIKRYLTEVVFDATAAKEVKEEQWWFETEDGILMRWCATFKKYATHKAMTLNLIQQIGIGR